MKLISKRWANVWLTLTVLIIAAVILEQVTCDAASGPQSGAQLTSIQVQESKSVSRLETYKNVQVFVYRIPLETTIASFTITSNASSSGCEVLPLKFHLRWRAIPVVSIESKGIVSYKRSDLPVVVDGGVTLDPIGNIQVESESVNQENTSSTSTFKTRLTQPYEYLLPENRENVAAEEDEETETILSQSEEELFQVGLKSDSVPVHINITHPLPGIWIGLAYINSTDDRIQQKGLFTRCTTWIQSRLTTHGLGSSLDGQEKSTTNGNGKANEKLVTLNAVSEPLEQKLSMSKSPKYYRFYTESSERDVQVTITNCSLNRILGSDVHSDPTTCPLKVNFRKRGLPSSEHKSSPTLNCSYLPAKCTIQSLPVTNDGFNYIEVSTIWQEEEDRNRDRYDYNVTFSIQVDLQPENCGQGSLAGSTTYGSISVGPTPHSRSGSISKEGAATTDHNPHKSSTDTITTSPTPVPISSTTVPVFEVIRSTEPEPETTSESGRESAVAAAEEEEGEKENDAKEKRATSSPSSSGADYETSSEETLTSPDVIDTVVDSIETIPRLDSDSLDTNPLVNPAEGSSHDSNGETSFVPGSNSNDNLNSNNDNDLPINGDEEFGAWAAHIPGGAAGFIPSDHFASPLVSGGKRHHYYERYLTRRHRSRRVIRHTTIHRVRVARAESLALSEGNRLVCPERRSLVRYNQQGSFNFRYDYSQGTGNKFNASKVFPDSLIPVKNSNENSTNLTILDFDIFDLLDSGGTLSIELLLDKKLLNTTYHNVTVEACLSYDNPSPDGDFSGRGQGSSGHCLKTIQVNSSSSPVINSNGKDSFVSELLVPFPKSGKWFLTIKSSCYFDRKDIISHITTSTLDPTSSESFSDTKSPKSVLKVVPVPCEYNTTSVTVRVKSSSCPSRCSEHGKCALVFPSSGEVTFGTCICKPGYTGWSCDQIDPKTIISEEQVLMNFLLLVLSNLLFILPIFVTLFRSQFVEATVYFITMISSALYHACDSSSQYSTCVLPMNLLSFGDFYSALLAFWVTLISLGNMRERCKSFFHFTGGMVIAFLVEYDRTSLWSFVGPVGTGVAIMMISWMTHCVRRRRCFPSGLLWCCSIFPGIVISSVGLVVYSLLETRDNYPITHSIWHGTCALALLFLVPSIRRPRRYRGGKSCCGPELDSDSDDDNDTFRTKGSSDTYYELITDEASHLARHLPPGSSGSHSNGAGGSAGQTYPTSAGMVPSSSHRNSVNYADRPIPAVRGHHHRESTRREVN